MQESASGEGADATVVSSFYLFGVERWCTRSTFLQQTLYAFILLITDLQSVKILGCTRSVTFLQTLYA